MKAEASWALVGLTCRLAQALGLHRGPHENVRVPTPTASDLPRRKLWFVLFPMINRQYLIVQVDYCVARQLALFIIR